MLPTRSFTVSALLAALLAMAPVDAKEKVPLPPVETLLTMHVDGDVFIETDGSVMEYRIETQAPAAMHQALDRAVRQWRFEPVLVDGQPARVMARMRLTLAATQAEKDYQVRIDNVVFPRTPEPAAAKKDPDSRPGFENPAVIVKVLSMKAPFYPDGLNKAGVSGRVLLGLRIGTDGRVAEAVALQSLLFDVGGRDANLAKAIALFEKAAIEGTKAWRFDVTPRGTGPIAAKDLTSMTTIEFVSWREEQDGKKATRDMPGKWRWISRLPKRQMPWIDPAGKQDVGVSDVRSGEVFPLASAVKLRTDVVGTVL